MPNRPLRRRRRGGFEGEVRGSVPNKPLTTPTNLTCANTKQKRLLNTTRNQCLAGLGLFLVGVGPISVMGQDGPYSDLRLLQGCHHILKARPFPHHLREATLPIVCNVQLKTGRNVRPKKAGIVYCWSCNTQHHCKGLPAQWLEIIFKQFENHSQSHFATLGGIIFIQT